MTTCTHCNYAANSEDRTTCQKCGWPLAVNLGAAAGNTLPRRTRALVAPKPTSGLMTRNKHVGKLGHNEVALYMTDFEAPLITAVTLEMVLGRMSRLASVTLQPAIDLTPFQAVERGVSREHAALRRIDGELALVDMGSTNGSWLNNFRLTPHLPIVINNGDRVVLGKLSLYVYFQ